MLEIKLTYQDMSRNVVQAVEAAAYRNFGHAAASIAKDAKSTIKTSRRRSLPGRPPRTKRGKLRRAIRFAASKTGALIGPIASVVGQSGNAHEFGGRFKNELFPARPFMGPALERNVKRFASSWAGSVGKP